MSVVCLLTFHNLIFSSETACPNEPKLDRKHLWKVLYRDYAIPPNTLTKIATIGNSCFFFIEVLLECVTIEHQILCKNEYNIFFLNLSSKH
jgi:hypothetical protein